MGTGRFLLIWKSSDELEILEHLPKLMCLVSGSDVYTLPRAVEYLNDRIYIDRRPTAELEYRCVNYNGFVDWWNKKIDGGGLWFYAMLDFMGVRKVYKVRFIDNITETIPDGGIRLGRMKMELEQIAFNEAPKTYMLLCDNDIDCNTILECF
jgi:hypothetical protein